MTELPLDDITVVSLEQAVAAPYATRQLADLGDGARFRRPGAESPVADRVQMSGI